MDKHDAPVLSLAFSPDGHWLASGSEDKTARLWPLDGSDQKAGSTALRGHAAAVTSLVFSPDGRWLVTGSKDQTIRQWLVDTQELIAAACQAAGPKPDRTRVEAALP